MLWQRMHYFKLQLSSANSNAWLERLPFDVLDRLLASLSSFACLRAAVLSCKDLYEVYSQRWRTILYSVMENEVGLAFQEALAMSRVTLDLEEYCKEDQVRDIVADKEGPYWTRGVITSEVAYILSQAAYIATSLENLFSFRYKDRSKRLSVLTCSESLAFRRALYRNWIISVLCGASYDEGEDSDYNYDDDDNEPDEEELLKKSGARFVRILSDLDDKSLCAVYQVLLFLDEVTVRTSPRQSFDPRTKDITLKNIPLQTREYTPLEIFYDFQEQDVDHLHDEKHFPASEVVTAGLDDLLIQRNITQMFEGNFGSQVILERVSEDYVTHCHRCHEATAWLYNDTCWSSLEEHIPVRLLVNFLPGLLDQNQSIRFLLQHYARVQVGLHFYHKLMEDIFALQSNSALDWRKDEWVCGECVLGFIKRELYGWLVRRQSQGKLSLSTSNFIILICNKDGFARRKNCWYGYKCRTQTREMVGITPHAQIFNHLCEPDPTKTDNI
ncbi:hypothetical protein SCHPADRAFT_560893 [Schizopora paradoxa]|uniref:Uncharacterized protein n=1 Tax=Schizopora paradoxa TaxID=27342 RepID=A0A0H2RCK4_9AGAM|nr:hypothetical protein SCHPADRAFT_560893 [Schizopora paradoxa]